MESVTLSAALASESLELLAPAGSWACAKAAVENGADAIYFGLERFNARMRSQNFTEADLPRLMDFLHRRGVKGYVTFNTLIFPSELAEAEQYLRTIMASGVDAAIVQDIGICRLIRHLSPDFPIHASTQMTITSAAGVQFAQQLGCQLVVLARECSLGEIHKIQGQMPAMPLEVFVHGALCVAYSGQCLTSESLGGRSANRGECAQACRMTYDLIVDGKVIDLGDRRYLLSPQDLAGLTVLPELIQSGVRCLKIEGRLKTPEYVANVTQVYRQAIDRIVAQGSGTALQDQSPKPFSVQQPDQYNLEMAFSRGLYTGWFNGIDNQALVHARFGKKRGVYLGKVTHIQQETVHVRLEAPLKPGDGVVFDGGHPELPEEGGRVYALHPLGSGSKSGAGTVPETVLTFGRNCLNWRRIQVGDRLWKTSDPSLDRQLQQSYAGDTPKFQQPIDLEVYGAVGETLVLLAKDRQGHVVQVESELTLSAAHTKPLTSERLMEQLGRLGNTPFLLRDFRNNLDGDVMLPVSELNRIRREMVAQLETLRSQPQPWQITPSSSFQDLLQDPQPDPEPHPNPELVVLVRNLDQLQVALQSHIQTIYCEFEDPRQYRHAVAQFRQAQQSDAQTLWVAPPRITKTGEQWILEQVHRSQADGYLIRNYDHLVFFAGERCIGDFSLNVANGITARYFKENFKLERLTASYDLDLQQLRDLLQTCPPHWFEVTLHQHMPMFHMEHCVFCAFLSDGKDFRDCGRPCETHQVKLRDLVGVEHILQADAGCRNTLFNGTAQTGAEHAHRLIQDGIRHLRLEFLQETPAQVSQTIQHYQKLLRQEIKGKQLWHDLKLQRQLGVTRGPLG